MWVIDASLDPKEALVMRALLRVEAAVTGRAVARIAGLTQSTAQRALTRLRDAGLVVAEPAPPSLLYRANRDHLATPALIVLLHLDEQLRERMADQVAGWQLAPASVIVYGSVARGEAKAGSDLDVLVVRPDATEPDEALWQRQVTALADSAQRWAGKRASVVEMSRREAADGIAEGEPFLVQADRDGWVIAGQRLALLAEHRA